MPEEIEKKLDEAQTIFLNRQLRRVKAKTYDMKFPNLIARELVPLATDVSPTQAVIVYEQYTQAGMAKIGASYADDAPRVDISGKQFTAQVRNVIDSYGYNIDEIEAAAEAGTDLKARKAIAARRAIDQAIENVVGFGDSLHGLLGLANQPNALMYTVPDGASTDPEWETKTAEEILEDMHGIAQYIVDETKEAEVPDTLLLPPTSYGLIARKRVTDSSLSILNAFLEADPNIKTVRRWAPLETAGAGGAKRMIAYRRDPEALELIIPREFEQLPEQARNYEFVVPCRARVGGVILYYPLSMAYGDEI